MAIRFSSFFSTRYLLHTAVEVGPNGKTQRRDMAKKTDLDTVKYHDLLQFLRSGAITD